MQHGKGRGIGNCEGAVMKVAEARPPRQRPTFLVRESRTATSSGFTFSHSSTTMEQNASQHRIIALI
jgi:hypothetical protein